MHGFSGIGLWFAPRAKEYMESCRSPVQKAYAASQIANVYTFSGQRERAIEIFNDAQAKLERYGHWHSPIVLHHTRRLYASNGDSQSELAVAIKEYAIAEQTGNTMGHAWGDFGAANALARMGRIDEALARSERAVQVANKTDSVYTRTVALQIRGFALLQGSLYAEARAACEGSTGLLDATATRNDYTLGVYALLAESLLGPRWTDRGLSRSAADLKHAWQVSSLGARAGRRFPNLLPHALRLRGRAAWALGKTQASVRLLHQAIDQSERLDTRYELRGRSLTLRVSLRNARRTTAAAASNCSTNWGPLCRRPNECLPREPLWSAELLWVTKAPASQRTSIGARRLCSARVFGPRRSC